jgi:hypothetical protein
VNPAPPLPRSGKLMAGGPNALELVWAMLALAVALAILASPDRLDRTPRRGWLAGTGWGCPAARHAAVLLDLAAPHDSRIAGSVEVWWRPPSSPRARPRLLAAVAMRAGHPRWLDWRDGWRHRQRTPTGSAHGSGPRRRDLAPTCSPTPARARAADEPAAAGRLLVGSYDRHDVLVPARTSVMAIAPTRTGKTSRLVVPNLLRWDGPAVVTSVKRDVYDLTVARRAELGPTYLFDPTGATGLPSSAGRRC